MNTENYSSNFEILDFIGPLLVGTGATLTYCHYQLKHQESVDPQKTVMVAAVATILAFAVARFGLLPVLNALAAAVKVAELANKPTLRLADVDMSKFLSK